MKYRDHLPPWITPGPEDYAPLERESSKARMERICGRIITGLLIVLCAVSWAAVCHLSLMELSR